MITQELERGEGYQEKHWIYRQWLECRHERLVETTQISIRTYWEYRNQTSNRGRVPRCFTTGLVGRIRWHRGWCGTEIITAQTYPECIMEAAGQTIAPPSSTPMCATTSFDRTRRRWHVSMEQMTSRKQRWYVNILLLLLMSWWITTQVCRCCTCVGKDMWLGNKAEDMLMRWETDDLVGHSEEV